MAVLIRPSRAGRAVLAGVALLCAAPAVAPGELAAQVFLTQDEALKQAFGAGATLERRTAYLTDAQAAKVDGMVGGGHALEQRVVTYYHASRAGKPLGVAYFDAHRVRTLPEVLMIAVGPDGRVARIEVLKFSEPPDYVAPESWLAQFDGRTLSDEVSLKGAIVNMTGATLTSGAVTTAVRRALALHRVIDPLGSAASGERFR